MFPCSSVRASIWKRTEGKMGGYCVDRMGVDRVDD